MSRPAREARELHRGFQTTATRADASESDHACLTLLAACSLSLATLIAVTTVSFEVVTAAALH